MPGAPGDAPPRSASPRAIGIGSTPATPSVAAQGPQQPTLAKTVGETTTIGTSG
jgi:hypothetical protein